MARVLLILVLILFSGSIIANDSELKAIEHLDTIKKFLHVAPERSRAVIINNQESTNYLDNNKKIKWYTAGATIGLKLNDLNLFEDSLKKISYLINAKNLKHNQAHSLTLIGHYSLKRTLLDEARSSYNCLYSLSKAQDDKVKAAYRISNAFLNDGNIDNAEIIMKELLRIAVNRGKQNWLGPIKSTMGIYALYRKEYLVAEKFFTESMLMHQEHQNYSGEFNSILNLLLTFLLSESDKFERIEYRVARLSKKNKDSDRHKLFQLIQLVKTSKLEGDNKKHQGLAMQYFEQIKSSTVKKAATDFIFPQLKMTVIESKVTYKANWIREFLVKLECEVQPVNLHKILNDLSGF